ncbi:MAG: VCBS repeat-containing protein [Planctomycetota bacterium]|nr:VCBS repeat-containing protein [Planctomycetota bacterium]
MSLVLAFALLKVGGAWEEMRVLASGSTQPDLFGHSIANVGDLDGDGADDLLIGSPWLGMAGSAVPGAAFLHSGATGARIRRHDSPSGLQTFGASVAGGEDLDGDLIPDYVVGNEDYHGPRPVLVYSGATGAILHQLSPSGASLQFGWRVAVLGDLDRDGVADIGVMSQSALFVFSGATGAQLAAHPISPLVTQFVGLDDLNGDMIPEIALGSPFESNLPNQSEGAVHVLSGATGATLHSWYGTLDNDYFGFDLVAVPDRDGDGRRDLLIGAPQYLDQGYVELVSTRTSATLMRWDRNSTHWAQNLGQCVGVTGDMDGDGVEEYLMGGSYMTITGSAGWRRGGLWIVSGASGVVLQEFEANYEEGFLGWDCVGLGDLDGDGLAEAAVSGIGAPLDAYPVSVPGAVSVYGFERFLDPSATELSASAGSSVSLSFDFPASAGGWEYRFLVSATGAGPARFGVDVPLTPDAFTLHSWNGAYPSAMHPQSLHGLLDGAGKASGSFGFAAGTLTTLVGRTLYAAAAAFPAGLPVPQISSAAVRFEVAP